MFCTFCFRSPLETLIRIHTFFFDMVQCIFVFPISVYLPRYQRFLNTLLLFLTRRYHYESLLSLYIAFLVKSGRVGAGTKKRNSDRGGAARVGAGSEKSSPFRPLIHIKTRVSNILLPRYSDVLSYYFILNFKKVSVSTLFSIYRQKLSDTYSSFFCAFVGSENDE